MLLTRNGRFNSDAFYTESPRFSQDNAYDNALLTQIKNVLKTNFNIDESLLAKWENGYKRSKGKLPTTVIAKFAKKATTPAASSSTPAAPTAPAAATETQPQNGASNPGAVAQAQPQTQQTPQTQQQTQGDKTTWDQLKTMVSKGQQFIFKTASDEYGGPWYLYKSNEPGNFFGFASQYNDGSYQVYPNPGWFQPDDQPFHEHYDDMDAAFEGVVKDGMGGVVKNIAPAIFAPDNSTKGQQQGRYKLIEKGIVEQELDTSQK